MIEVKTHLVNLSSSKRGYFDVVDVDSFNANITIYEKTKLIYWQGYISIDVNGKNFLNATDFDYVYWFWMNISNNIGSILTNNEINIGFPDQPRILKFKKIEKDLLRISDFDYANEVELSKIHAPMNEFLRELAFAGQVAFVLIKNYIKEDVDQFILNFEKILSQVE